MLSLCWGAGYFLEALAPDFFSKRLRLLVFFFKRLRLPRNKIIYTLDAHFPPDLWQPPAFQYFKKCLQIRKGKSFNLTISSSMVELSRLKQEIVTPQNSVKYPRQVLSLVNISSKYSLFRFRQFSSIIFFFYTATLSSLVNIILAIFIWKISF